MNIFLFHFINSARENEIKHNKVGDWVTAIASRLLRAQGYKKVIIAKKTEF